MNGKKNNIVKEINFGLPCDRTFGYLVEFLRSYGINSNINCNYSVSKYNIGDIIACEGFSLYQLNSEGNIVSQKDDVGLHYVYITDILDDGTIFVSSWGKKYIFDPTNALDISKVLVKINS